MRERFAELIRRRTTLDAEKAALIVDERTYAQQLDLLRFQTNEIAAARLQPDEELDLDRHHRLASHAARLLELTQTARRQLADDEGAVTGQMAALGRTLHELPRLDAEAGNLTALHEQAASALRELQAELARYADKLELDPARLRELEERLDLVQGLKRKYGTTLADVIAFGEQAREKLVSLEQRDAELARLNGERAKLDRELRQAGETLSAQRRKVIPKLVMAVTSQLADLGFKQSHFGIQLKTDVPGVESTVEPRPAASGFDSVEFQFAPNPGEPPRPLRAIASSGELARVMLGLKTVLAAQDNVPVLVFDEVDANVGGETAAVVGQKMHRLGAKRQVLCITHLAPVAATAAAHYLVTKELRQARTVTGIHRLEPEERVTELARMLGGQSEESRRHAKALLRSMLATKLDHRAVATAGHHAMEPNVRGAKNGDIGLPHARGTERGEVA
jgi:DNA repair protein RecN (Recombination protein N)